jgi:hypothetical protein
MAPPNRLFAKAAKRGVASAPPTFPGSLACNSGTSSGKISHGVTDLKADVAQGVT